MATLKCSMCHETKPSDGFGTDRRNPTGRNCACRTCLEKARNSRRFPDPCPTCKRHRRLNENGVCGKCNRARGLRQCWKCHHVLPAFVSFYANSTACKQCLATVPRERECDVCLSKFVPTGRQLRCSEECVLKYRSDWQKSVHTTSLTHRRKRWAAAMKRAFGVTVEEFDEMLLAQDGRCAVCSRPLEAGPGQIHVDHCHDTGAVRGVLCRNCNIGLGHFKDSARNLAAAIEYLKKKGPTAGGREPLG